MGFVEYGYEFISQCDIYYFHGVRPWNVYISPGVHVRWVHNPVVLSCCFYAEAVFALTHSLLGRGMKAGTVAMDSFYLSPRSPSPPSVAVSATAPSLNGACFTRRSGERHSTPTGSGGAPGYCGSKVPCATLQHAVPLRVSHWMRCLSVRFPCHLYRHAT